MKRRQFLKASGAAALLSTGVPAWLDQVLGSSASWVSSALASTEAARPAKVVCLGLDGMDPVLLHQYMAIGALPNFARLEREGGFRVLGTSIPPQSPVAWSNFITGQDPGGHAIFDFIHRTPQDLLPHLSISEARAADRFWRLGKWKLPRGGGGVRLLRQGRAFWELLASAGVDVTIFKCPSNFPPVPCRARTLSGMGTPDILGTYGIFSYYTDSPPENTDIGGGRVVPVKLQDGRFQAEIHGPANTYREGDPECSVPFTATVDPVNPVACIDIQDRRFVLQTGEWSEWITLHYDLIPLMKKTTGICRFFLMEAHPRLRLYVTPVQIDPAAPAMPICTPEDYSRELVDATGPFYTQGLPDDTKALDEGVFSDDEYLSQADLVLAERRSQFTYELERFRRLSSGFLFFYFSSLDQNCHMFWRNMDPQSPLHAAAGGRHAGRIRDLYCAMDGVLGQTLDAIDEETTLLVLSDHGFAPFHRAFHVNTWLLEQGYLNLRPGVRRQEVQYLSGIDWSRTRAYALGINGLYLNLQGRERNGIIRPDTESERLLEELSANLEDLTDAQTGVRPVKHAYRADRVYHGPHARSGPDIVLGYQRAYRGSNEAALGKVPETVLEDNPLKWSGDHCMAADEVPGVLLSNRPLSRAEPTLMDLAPTILGLFGLGPTPEMRGCDVFAPEA